LLALCLAVPAAFGGEPPAATPAALGLEIDGEGRCTGLRVGGTILPWVPSVPRLDRETASATQRDKDREVVHRVLPDAHGLRWTQTIRNLTANPIGIGPAFNAQGGEGKPWTAPGLPLRVFMFPKEDVGVSLIQPPDEAIWNNGQRKLDPGQAITFAERQVQAAAITCERKLDPGQSITFTAFIRVHEADWRPSVAALVAACPNYMNPSNPRVHQVAGGGAYSNYDEAPDAEKSLMMGFRVNWNARFDFAAIGMYVAPSPVSVDTTWTDIRGRDTSIARMASYATRMRQAGFHVLSYFNLTEAGHRIQEPAPPRVAAKDEDLWRNPNDWVHHGIRDAVLESAPGKIQYTNWEKCVVVDPAEPKYRAHLIDQATRLVRDLPDADGIAIDRMDHLVRNNGRRYDGLGFYNGRAEGAWLMVSWMQVMDDIGPIMHKADKVIFANPIRTYALAAYRHLDGVYTEYWREIEACSLLCVNKPLIVWSGPYDDAGMQKLLHHGAWPTCPMPGADHSQGPDPVKGAMVADYGPMFDALRGRRWALHARPIACDGPTEATVNLFVIPGGYLAIVTAAGDAREAKIRLPGLPLPDGVETLKAWSIVPAGEWESVEAMRQGKDWRLTVPLARGCGVVRLHWAWIEPFQPWWSVRPSIDVQTTVTGGEIRAVTDGAALTAGSPLWKQPLTPSGSMTLRAGVWKHGRKIGDDLVATFIEATPAP
jgi:hypothetical protein